MAAPTAAKLRAVARGGPLGALNGSAMLAGAARRAPAAARRVAASAPRAAARCTVACACAPRAWLSPSVSLSGCRVPVDLVQPLGRLLPARARGVAPLPPPRRARTLPGARPRGASGRAGAAVGGFFRGGPCTRTAEASRCQQPRAGSSAARRARGALPRAAEPRVGATASVDARARDVPEPPPPLALRLLLKVLAQQAVLSGWLFALLFSWQRFIADNDVFTPLAFLLLTKLADDDGWAEPLFAAPRERPVEAPPGGESDAFARARVHVECLLYAMARNACATWAAPASVVNLARAHEGTHALFGLELIAGASLLAALLTLREETRMLRSDMRKEEAARAGGTGRP